MTACALLSRQQTPQNHLLSSGEARCAATVPAKQKQAGAPGGRPRQA